MKWSKLYVILIFVLVIFVVLLGSGFSQLRFNPVTRDAIIDLLAPLFIIALFLERALEVFVKTWRRLGRDTYEREVAKAKEALERAKQANQPTQPAQADLDHRLDELTKYKATTGRIAFLSGVSAGVLISIVGVRVLYPLTDLGLAQTTEQLPGAQLVFFNLVDVFLTGGLIGGGSEGIHKIVAVITDFLDKTRQKIQASP